MFLEIIDVVSYAFKMVVAPVFSSGHKANWFTCVRVNVHVSTKTCVTGKNVILHMDLIVSCTSDKHHSFVRVSVFIDNTTGKVVAYILR